MQAEGSTGGLPETADGVLAQQINAVQAAPITASGLKEQTLRGLKAAQTVTPAEHEVMYGGIDADGQPTGSVRGVYDGVRSIANEKGLNLPDRQNYIARPRWVDEPSPEDTLPNNPEFAQSPDRPNNNTLERKFDTTVDGITATDGDGKFAGKVPVKVGGEYSFGLADNLHDYQNRMGKEIAARVYNETAEKTFDDQGRPLAVPIGDLRDAAQTVDGHAVLDDGRKVFDADKVPLDKLTDANGDRLMHASGRSLSDSDFASYDRSIRNKDRKSVV